MDENTMNMDLLRHLEDLCGEETRNLLRGKPYATERDLDIDDDDQYLLLAQQHSISMYDFQYFVKFQEHILALTQEVSSIAEANFLEIVMHIRIQARRVEIASRPAGE